MKNTDQDPRFTSRKLIISVLATIIACILPIIYKHMNIGDSVTMAVLGIVSALAIGYGGLNILDKKINQ